MSDWLGDVDTTTKVIALVISAATLFGLKKFFERSINQLIARVFAAFLAGMILWVVGAMISEQEFSGQMISIALLVSLPIGALSWFVEETLNQDKPTSGAIGGIIYCVLLYLWKGERISLSSTEITMSIKSESIIEPLFVFMILGIIVGWLIKQIEP